MKKLTREEFINIATEMYADGTYYSERYSRAQWKSRGWPEIKDVRMYVILDSYIKFLRVTDEFHGKRVEDERFGNTGVLERVPPRNWNK